MKHYIVKPGLKDWDQRRGQGFQIAMFSFADSIENVVQKDGFSYKKQKAVL